MRSNSRVPALALAIALGFSATAFAQSPDRELLFHPNLDTDLPATFDAPIVLGRAVAADPVWTRTGLWADRPEALWGLAQVEDARPPVWDPSSDTWFAWALGMLVQVRPDGSLPVILESLPGHDFDIRAAKGLLVYRDPARDEIVLVRLDGKNERRVLLSGFHFFNPRFSPDGTRIVVSESRAEGGHLWLIEVDGERATDLGRGEQASWSADGRHLVFLKIDHDGHRLTASSLYTRDIASGVERRLAVTRAHLALQPRLSPDGRFVAFVDEETSSLMLSRLPKEVR
ncbi:MAG TPA: hypothetical protein VGK67_27910 [Myxococcales bacterium]|jgi:hypothetical protein